MMSDVNRVWDTVKESTKFFPGTLKPLARLAALSGAMLALSAC